MKTLLPSEKGKISFLPHTFAWFATALLVSLWACRAAAEDEKFPPFNYGLGTQTFGVQYQFTKETRLVETARTILDMGSNILKCHLGRGSYGSQYHLPENPDVKSLRDLVEKDPSYVAVLNMPFDFYLFWAYPFGPQGAKINWRDGLSEEERDWEYKEIHELTVYLLKTFSGTGKTFYLGHWEGDWSLMGSPYSPKRTPSDKNIQGMIDWLNLRQDAVEAAKTETPHNDVQVYHYTEVNLARKAIEGGRTVTNDVLPKTRVDYVSYSCYDSLAAYRNKSLDEKGRAQALRTQLQESLDYIESKLPAKDVPGKRVFLGEYGFALRGVGSPQEQDKAARIAASAGLEWGCPFVLYWAMYGNENGRGFWLIDDKGEKQPVYETHRRFLEHARDYVSEYRREHGTNPSPSQYSKRAITWLNPVSESL